MRMEGERRGLIILEPAIFAKILAPGLPFALNTLKKIQIMPN